MARRSFTCFLFCILGLLPGMTSASEPECPSTIAAIDKDHLNQSAKKILRSLYKNLGCDVDFFDLPARRGISHFNQGIVDGEVYRLRQAESHYDRDFVRSKKPLFVISNSLWLNPHLKNNERLQIGYILGVVWQENYLRHVTGRAFANSMQMYEAYNKRQIKGFLAADFGVHARIKANKLSPVPEIGEILLKAPLYHYLGKEFAPVMGRLVEKLKAGSLRDIGNVAVEK